MTLEKKIFRILAMMVMFFILAGSFAVAFDLDPGDPISDTVPPTVDITSHINYQTVSGTIKITALASDNIGIYSVGFSIGDTPIGTDYSSPYYVYCNTRNFANGLYRLKATAIDTSGNYAQDIIYIRFSNDYLNPTLKIISPSNYYVHGEVPIAVEASDDKGIAKIDFYLTDTFLGSDSNSPYIWTINSLLYPDAVYTIKTIAYDTSGNKAEDRKEIKILNEYDTLDPITGEPIILLYNGVYNMLKPETFALIDINFQIKLWSNQRVEAYAYYIFHDTNPNVAVFDYIAVRAGLVYGTSPIGYNIDIPHYAPEIYKWGSTDVYGDISNSSWNGGTIPILIDVQMMFQSVYNAPGECLYAIQRLVLYNMGTYAQGYVAYEGVEITSKIVIPDIWYP